MVVIISTAITSSPPYTGLNYTIEPLARPSAKDRERLRNEVGESAAVLGVVQ